MAVIKSTTYIKYWKVRFEYNKLNLNSRDSEAYLANN